MKILLSNQTDFFIDGVQAVKVEAIGEMESIVTTADGRQWYWVDSSYMDNESHRFISDGFWQEYKQLSHE